MTLQELKDQAVKRFNDVKAKAVSFIDETAAPKVRELASRLGVAKDDAMTKRAAIAKVYIETDDKNNVTISISGKKKDIKAALEHILGD